MTTPFSDIYRLFLSKITDYEILQLSEEDLEANMQDWLLSAIGYFTICKKDLTDFDLEKACFNEDLNVLEKNILSHLMVYVYVDTHAVKEQNLKNMLNSKDYRSYSPANLLNAILNLKEQVESDVNTLMSRYSYNIHNVKELFEK